MDKESTRFVREAVHQTPIDKQQDNEEPEIWTV